MEDQINFSLDEIKNMSHIEFWLRQFKEHALFIYLGIVEVNDIALEIREKAEEWMDTWEKLLIMCLKKENIREDVKENVKPFIKFKEYVMEKVSEEWMGYLIPDFLDHIKSEVIYFYEREFKNMNSEDKIFSFWVEINQEHVEYTSTLLNLDEKEKLQQLTKFSRYFQNIKDYSSEEDQLKYLTVQRSKELDKFIKNTGKENVKSIIHPLLLAHVRRETQRGIAEMMDFL